MVETSIVFYLDLLGVASSQIVILISLFCVCSMIWCNLYVMDIKKRDILWLSLVKIVEFGINLMEKKKRM